MRRALIAGLIAVLCLARVGVAAEPLIVAVKATYLYKLAQFVDWPAAAFPSASSAFDLCVIGDDPFGLILDRAIAGQTVAGHPIVVHRLAGADRGAGCEMAYVAGSRGQTVKESLRLLRGAPVLTVTDDPTAPGIVDFVTVQGRVRFRIDDQAAAESNLTISSKLLTLAVSVVPRKATGASL